MSEKLTLIAEDCVKINNFLYFIAKNVNILCSLDLRNGQISLLDSIPENRILAPRAGAAILHWKGELIFSPMLTKKIWRYNISTKEWKGYERKKYNSKLKNEMFQEILYENKIFFIGTTYPAIIVLDLIDGGLTYIDEPYKKLEHRRMQLKDCFFRMDHVKMGHLLFLASCVSNEILRLDLSTYDYELIKVGSLENRYVGIAWDGKNFWIAPRKTTPIVKWDGCNECEEIALPEEFADDKYIFGSVVCREGRVYLNSYNDDKSLVLDCNNNETMIVQKRYIFMKKMEDKTYIEMASTGGFNIDDGNQIIFRSTDIPKDSLIEYLSLKGEVIKESKIVNLGDFIEAFSAK